MEPRGEMGCRGAVSRGLARARHLGRVVGPPIVVSGIVIPCMEVAPIQQGRGIVTGIAKLEGIRGIRNLGAMLFWSKRVTKKCVCNVSHTHSDSTDDVPYGLSNPANSEPDSLSNAPNDVSRPSPDIADNSAKQGASS